MNNHTEVKESFSKQAEKFASYHMSKAEYTDYLIKRVDPQKSEHALEVAAGTCICGRALAPFVQDMTCLDLTEAMLAKGKELAEKSNLSNITFVEGNAEKLPYEDAAFDLVITRLSLHHFPHLEVPFKEMKRVLKTGGKLVVWDMEATNESLREIDDSIETLRDPSHVRILSRNELEELFKDDFNLVCEESSLIPVNLQAWMDLTDANKDIQEKIIKLMQDDLNGGAKTGFHPYVEDGAIKFHHRWLLLIGIKR